MFKSIMFAGLIAATGAATAASSSWQFNYTGFQNSMTGDFLQDYQISGKFTGDDGNADGIVDLTELSSFIVNGTEYIGCGTDSPYYHCGTDSFSFHIGGALDFSAGIYGTDPEGWFGGGHYFQAGVGEFDYHYNPDAYNEQAYLWTGQTTLTISSGTQLSNIRIPAVPEPGAWAMLAAGLLVIGGAAMRRREPMLIQQPA
jgi:hypothetical protein